VAGNVPSAGARAKQSKGLIKIIATSVRGRALEPATLRARRSFFCGLRLCAACPRDHP
jgi:hypothetical protein